MFFMLFGRKMDLKAWRKMFLILENKDIPACGSEEFEWLTSCPQKVWGGGCLTALKQQMVDAKCGKLA